MPERTLDDYNEVAHRIQEFRDRYPEGSLSGDWRLERVGDQAYLAYRAEAYRTPDDAAPGVGCAWELVPGRTNFTRGSELQNAETSAWGRAIIACGAADAKKGIASREEVQLQRTATKIPGPGHERLRYGTVVATPDDRPAERSHGPVDNSGDDPWAGQPPGEFDIGQPEDRPGTVDDRQLKQLGIAFTNAGITDRGVRLGMVADMVGRDILTSKQLSRAEAKHVLDALQAQKGETS
jgi:hypothetical protein